MDSPHIVWFRKDLRLLDHPALFYAAQNKQAIIPLYIYSPDEEGEWPLGTASRWWLHHSLIQLDHQLQEKGLQLIIRKGRTLNVLKEVLKETNAKKIFTHSSIEPYEIQIEKILQNQLPIEFFPPNVCYHFLDIKNKQNKPFQIFTYFWKHCLLENEPRMPLPIPKLYGYPIKSESLKSLFLFNRDFSSYWKPGEKSALEKVHFFKQKGVSKYEETRNFPDNTEGVSTFSPHLHFGELSASYLWHEFKQDPVFLRQLGWREFASYFLFYFPNTSTESFKTEFKKFPWKIDTAKLLTWQQGKTGYPIVDAGMRQLLQTGWMHNRVRMIVGSFVVKDLMQPWLEGAKWFWENLVDADLANNTMGWQWVAGTGADSAPYFRIFNPVLQSKKFDPMGRYIKTYVPELKLLNEKWIHEPWKAPIEELKKANLHLGENYPLPIVDHDIAKNKALEAFYNLKNKSH